MWKAVLILLVKAHQVKPLWHRQTFLSSCSNCTRRLNLLTLTLEAFFSIYLFLAHWALQPPINQCRKLGTLPDFSPHTVSPVVPAQAAPPTCPAPHPRFTSPLLPWLVKPAFPRSLSCSQWKEKKNRFYVQRGFSVFLCLCWFLPWKNPWCLGRCWVQVFITTAHPLGRDHNERCHGAHLSCHHTSPWAGLK